MAVSPHSRNFHEPASSSDTVNVLEPSAKQGSLLEAPVSAAAASARSASSLRASIKECKLRVPYKLVRAPA